MNNEQLKLKCKFFERKCETYIDEMEQIVDVLENNTIVRDRKKDKKHRPVNAYNVATQESDNKVNSINLGETNGHISDITINYKATQIPKKKKKKKSINTTLPCITEEKKSINATDEKNEHGLSLFDMNGEDEKKRICGKYKEEINFYKNVLKALHAIRNNCDYDKLENIVNILNNNNVTSRIIICNDQSEMKEKGFFEGIEYNKCYVISPPMNNSFLHSFYYVDHQCYLSNAYYFVRNNKNEWHFFYGFCEQIKCDALTQKIFETVQNDFSVDNLMYHMFEECVINKQSSSILFSSVSMTINGITHVQKNDDELLDLFLKFLKMNLCGHCESLSIENCTGYNLINNASVSTLPCLYVKFKIFEPDIIYIDRGTKYKIITKNIKERMVNEISRNYFHSIFSMVKLNKLFVTYDTDYMMNVAIDHLNYSVLLDLITRFSSACDISIDCNLDPNKITDDFLLLDNNDFEKLD